MCKAKIFLLLSTLFSFSAFAVESDCFDSDYCVKSASECVAPLTTLHRSWFEYILKTQKTCLTINGPETFDVVEKERYLSESYGSDIALKECRAYKKNVLAVYGMCK